MFNPYACRPIGSDKFEEHLKDVQTKSWYFTEMPEEPDKNLLQQCNNSKAPWHQETVKGDPYDNLLWAIVICSFIDYLDAYEHKLECGDNRPGYWVWESRCISLENSFFRVNGGFLEEIFDKMLLDVCWMGLDEIRKCKKRLLKVNGWVVRPDVGTAAVQERKVERQKAAEAKFIKLYSKLENEIKKWEEN